MIVSYPELINELKSRGVEFMTKAEVLNGKEPKKVGVVIQHDVDSGGNLIPTLSLEKRMGVKSSVYLIPDGNDGCYDYDYDELMLEFPEHEFGLHFGLKEHLEEGLPFDYETVSPHGVYENKEYPEWNSFEYDKLIDNGNYGFVEYCREKWDYEGDIEYVRYYTKSRKTWSDIPCKGVFIIDDSRGFIKPYTIEEALDRMKEGVFLFLIHPENLDGIYFLNREKIRKHIEYIRG